jgi:hypothetical protein
VNFVNEAEVLECVPLLPSLGYDDDHPTLINWDVHMGHPLASTMTTEMNVRFLVETGAGLLQSANLGFLEQHDPYEGLSPRVIGTVNPFAFAYQLTCCLALPILLLAFLTHNLRVAVLGFVIASLLFTGIGFSSQRRSGLRVCFRRLILTAVWPFVSSMAMPLAMPGLLTLPILGLILYLAFVSPLSPFNQNLQTPWLAGGILYPVCAIIGVYLVAAICRMLRNTVLATILKIVADVFRYIGLPSYRSKMQELMRQKVQPILDREPRRILFLTHSLGSVVAVDFLRTRGDLFANIPEVTLVTMGSPLRRLLATFFPGYCEDPAALLEQIRSKIALFRWINVYRPHDPIGRDLSIPSKKLVSASTEQRVGRWLQLPAHLAYWSDRCVFSRIASALAAQAPMAGSESSESRALAMPVPTNLSEYGWYEPSSVRGRIWSRREAWFQHSDLFVKRLTTGWVAFSFAFIGYELSVFNPLEPPSRKIASIATLGFVCYIFRDLWPSLVRPCIELSTVCINRFPEIIVPTDEAAARKALKDSFEAKRAIVKNLGTKALVSLGVLAPLIALQLRR